jgi:hypothetical protein
LHYYGFKLGLRISRDGMNVWRAQSATIYFALLPARPHDRQRVDDFLDGFQGVAFQRRRKRVETVGSHLTKRFHVGAMRATTYSTVKIV